MLDFYALNYDSDPWFYFGKCLIVKFYDTSLVFHYSKDGGDVLFSRPPSLGLNTSN